MVREQLQFDRRVKRLSRKHTAMTRGYSINLRPDGLIVTQPRRARPRVSLKAIVLFAVAFLGFKGLMIASVGFATYEERLLRLQEGTPVERAGAWIMHMDPVSTRVAEKIKPYLP